VAGPSPSPGGGGLRSGAPLPVLVGRGGGDRAAAGPWGPGRDRRRRPGDPDAPARLLSQQAAWPRWDLVNSAAVFPRTNWWGLAGAVDHTLAVNLRAPVLLTRAFAAALPRG